MVRSLSGWGDPEGRPDSFRLSLQVKVADPDYLKNSLKFMAEKYGRKLLNSVAPSYFDRFYGSPPVGMGHGWVRLSTYVGSKIKESYSLGFYPGRLDNPDNAGMVPSGGDPPKYVRMALDHDIPERNFEDALSEAYRWKIQVEPPTPRHNQAITYALYGENCVSFVRAIAQAAGVKFSPSKAPAYNSSEGFAMVDNPNMMLSELEKSKFSYNPVTEGAPKQAPTRAQVEDDMRTGGLSEYTSMQGPSLEY